MPTFNFDGIHFYYQDDNSEGIPFIFLHGLGGDVNQTQDILNEIPHIRRITIDFRGHGKTIKFGETSKLSFHQFADDVKALIDFLEIDQFIIGGISTGAGVALNFVLRHPKGIQKLVLSRPAWEDKPQPEIIQEAFRIIYQILNDDSVLDYKEAFKQTVIYQKMNEISGYAGKTLLGQFDYPYARETSPKLIYIPSDCPNNSKSDWKSVSVPTLILASKKDPLHPLEFAETIHAGILGSNFKEITSKTISGREHKMDTVTEIHEFIKN
ncbi:alpha/beta fold hydrolase [Oceanobacillus neutriphilus]|uniref:Hydrolase n=1 Tax=Oceanobacillus neutriphilus TaxID=531815 RepID=A0ABQ2NYL9_9BACI|nr:alpha/beta hydrolase [Oceanobacillus neutriphilus]GGP13862.1 hydrolase [Oceanobacillus neutriphilus]